MALVITSAPSDELLTVEDARQHLRVYTTDLDSDILAKIRAARDWCERWTQRTLRSTTTRTKKLAAWWCNDYRLPWPPLISVSSVTYYDASNNSQTLSISNYHVETSADGAGRLVWATNATIPGLYDRPDAVTITFTTGYTTIESSNANPLPPVALQAMKLATEMFWKAGTDEASVIEKAAKSLLGTVDWTGYA